MEDHRKSPRVNVKVPVDLRPGGSGTPMRGTTSDLSLTGCYVEMRFTFPVGTRLDLYLELGHTLYLKGKVVTNTPQVGNGILFEDLTEDDRKELQACMEAAEKTQASSA